MAIKSILDSTLKGSLELMRGQIEPLIINQPTLPIRVRDRQMSQLHNVLDKLEKAVETKGPNGEKSCSHMETFEPPNDKLRIVSLYDNFWTIRIFGLSKFSSHRGFRTVGIFGPSGFSDHRNFRTIGLFERNK